MLTSIRPRRGGGSQEGRGRGCGHGGCRGHRGAADDADAVWSTHGARHAPAATDSSSSAGWRQRRVSERRSAHQGFLTEGQPRAGALLSRRLWAFSGRGPTHVEPRLTAWIPLFIPLFFARAIKDQWPLTDDHVNRPSACLEIDPPATRTRVRRTVYHHRLPQYHVGSRRVATTFQHGPRHVHTNKRHKRTCIISLTAPAPSRPWPRILGRPSLGSPSPAPVPETHTRIAPPSPSRRPPVARTRDTPAPPALRLALSTSFSRRSRIPSPKSRSRCVTGP